MDNLPQMMTPMSKAFQDHLAGLNCLEVPEMSPKTKSKKKSKKGNNYSIRFKTDICRNWQNGFCEFGENCAFAHGMVELKSSPSTPEKPSKLCKQFFESGYCISGS